MNPNDFLVTRLNQITEAVIQKDWGRAYTLIEEWESDNSASADLSVRLSINPNRKQLDSIPYDGWEVVEPLGIEFEELGECFN